MIQCTHRQQSTGPKQPWTSCGEEGLHTTQGVKTIARAYRYYTRQQRVLSGVSTFCANFTGNLKLKSLFFNLNLKFRRFLKKRAKEARG
jgi:hypothetical protein